MATPPLLTSLDTETLLTRGFFHDRLIPPFSSTTLAGAMPALQRHIATTLQAATTQPKFGLNIPRSRPVEHSVPKRKHLRRMLAIPHPRAYAIMCDQVALNWAELHALCTASPLSMSTPSTSQHRAVQASHGQSSVANERAQRSVGQRFLLKTDLVRFYPSIYTHSIPWAIHGKEAARADTINQLWGNRLDVCLQALQDKQTGGIPIGPDTSYIIAEMLSSRIDQMLQDRLAPLLLKGTRFIDDYHLYFRTRADAEKAIAALHGVARYFDLEINDAKTEIVELPEAIDPSWKTILRTHVVIPDDYGISCKSLFDRAAELAKQYPNDSVYTYVAKKLLHTALSQNIWIICEPLLYRAALAEPSMLPVLLQIVELNGLQNQAGLTETIESLCNYHAPLQHGFEVAWSLWLACHFGIALQPSTVAIIAKMDDDIVALACLDLRSRQLAPGLNPILWASRMNAANLYSDHWLLAYEAQRKGWLQHVNGTNYVVNDPFFSLLAAAGVSFYDENTLDVGEDPQYADDDFAEDEEESENDEEDVDGEQQPETLEDLVTHPDAVILPLIEP
jgi:hypothetical protein